jgi:hypothetical protein
VPAPLRSVSSTQVRQCVRRLREQGIASERWPEALRDCVAPEIASHIARFGLY